MENDSNPMVSILIPLYNQKKYFGACMRSVCNQTYKNLEIVIVNDGSTDCSPQMAHDWAAKDSRVKVIDKHNEGLAFARRDGLYEATGEFVMFLDSDDSLPRRSVETMVHCAMNNEVDLVMGSWNKMVGFIKRCRVDSIFSFPYNQLITQPELFDKYYLGFFKNSVFPVNVCGKLYRKSIIEKALKETELYSPDVPFMGEDQFFNVNLFPYLRSMYRIEDVVYNYRYGGGTHGYNKNFPQLFISSDKRLKLLDKYNYNRGYKPLFDEYVACFYHHAAQLIWWKNATKESVFDFFKQELGHRELIFRMKDYYEDNDNQAKQVRYILKEDYERMYDFALVVAKQDFGSFKYKMSYFLIGLFSHFS